MNRLWLQVVGAALLGGILLFGTRGGGAIAGSVHRLAQLYLSQEIRLPAGLAAMQDTPRRKAGRKAAPLFSWPLVGEVLPHPGGGIEILAPGGALVRAAASGTVSAVAPSSPGVEVSIAGNGVVLRYLHLGPNDVHKGEAVRRGEVIGALSHFAPGETPHLTLEASQGRRQLALPGVLGRP